MGIVHSVTASTSRQYWLALALVASSPAVAQIDKPGTAPAKGPSAPKPEDRPAASQASDPRTDAPIVPQAEFDSALPPLSGDLNAPLERMPIADASSAAAATSDRKSTRLNSSHCTPSRMPSSA